MKRFAILSILVLFLAIMPAQAQTFTAIFAPLPNLNGTTGSVNEPGTDFPFDAQVINSGSTNTTAQVIVFIGSFTVCTFTRQIPANTALPFECGVLGEYLVNATGYGTFQTGIVANSTTIFGYNVAILTPPGTGGGKGMYEI